MLVVRLRKRYIEEQEKKRQGQCNRCGACCKLLFNCPYLEEKADGSFNCKIHQKRPFNCRVFPIDQSDIKDRDSKHPTQPCGFYFKPEK